MKKRSLLVPLLLLTSLGACENSQPKKLSYDVVKYALDNVDSAFENITYGESEIPIEVHGNYADVFSTFEESDYRGHTPPTNSGLSYEDQPLLEFRYMKGIFDTADAAFKFGENYFDTVLGSTYFNRKTGDQTTASSTTDGYGYQFAIYGNIDVNRYNQIKSSVAIASTYSNGTKTFETIRYVNILLDYDFEATSPTFRLKIVSENDETKVPFSGYYTYSYDYFVVSGSQIMEWRNFSMEASSRLNFDEDHTSFGDYVEDEIAYRVNAPKWYLNGKFYETRNMPVTKQNQIGNKYFSMGLFAQLTADVFIAKAYQAAMEGVGINEIDSLDTFDSLSRECGKDLGYKIIQKQPSTIDYVNKEKNPNIDPDDVEDPPVEEEKPTKIKIYENDNVTEAKMHSVDNITFREILLGYTDYTYNSVRYKYWYANDKGNIKQITVNYASQLSNFTIYFISEPKAYYTYSSFKALEVNVNDKIYDAFKIIHDTYDNTTDISSAFKVRLFDKSKGVMGDIPLYYGPTLSFEPEKPVFPAELTALGIPTYEGENVEYDLTKMGGNVYKYDLRVTNTNDAERLAYFDSLTLNGFVLDNIYGTEYVFRRSQTYYEDLFLKIFFGSDTVFIDVYSVSVSNKGNLTTTFPSIYTSYGLPTYTGANPSFDPSSDYTQLYIYNTNYSEVCDYEEKLVASGFYLSDQSGTDGWKKYSIYLYGGRQIITVTMYHFFAGCPNAYMTFSSKENTNYNPNNYIEGISLLGDFNSWGTSPVNSRHIFYQDGSGSSTTWRLSQISLTMGREFKMCANNDWSFTNDYKNPSAEGFGYDDVANIGNYQSIFTRGVNGKILVTNNCLLSIYTKVVSGKLWFYFEASILFID